MPTDEALLTCRKLEVGYGGRALLPALDLTIHRGEFWAVIGRNGSGKTTWLRTLLGLLPPVSGSIVHERQLRLSYLAQRHTFDDLYPLLVQDIVAMGLDRKRSFLFPLGVRSSGSVERALKLVSAEDLAPRPFRQLSEGQKQRVLFARVAAAEPDMAVLDEPTSAMDRVAEREATELLKHLQQETGLALLVVSHYLGIASEYADRAVLLDRDTPTVVVGPPSEVFGHESFQKRYGESIPPARDNGT